MEMSPLIAKQTAALVFDPQRAREALEQDYLNFVMLILQFALQISPRGVSPQKSA